MIFFSKNLKFLREKQNMTQGELAKLLELKSNSISNYENGVSEPDYNILKRIVDIYKVSAHDILYSDMEMTTENKKSSNLIYPSESAKDFIEKLCDLSAENALLKKENEDLKNLNKKTDRMSDVPSAFVAEKEIEFNKKTRKR
ncbi:helix-turn-helix domain-containing protein [Parabacteroides sp. Marseille-P3160]|uniref:helix-turn-helix domain-containing protein n=1 Tax=Parabacteroides sp. Marseille-P3160 TaxID=1917887 RepID=UPI001117D075|nr:helix-turn-helix transcriptional regulator [Parabacteroides sp. Marseille-P3160]